MIGVTASAAVCAGGDITFTATELPGATYIWTGDAGSTTYEAVVTGVTSGTTYAGTVKATVDGCDSEAVPYTQTAYVSPEVTEVTSVPVCPGEVITFTATATGASTYLWTGDADNTSVTATASTEAVTSGTTYQGTVTAISSENCPSQPFAYSQTAYTTPVLSLKPVAPVCLPDVARLGDAIDWTLTDADQVLYYDDASMNTQHTATEMDEPGTQRIYAVGVSASGCLSQPMAFELTVNELTLQYQTEFELCYGEDLTFEVAGLGMQKSDYDYRLADETGEEMEGKSRNAGYAWAIEPESTMRYALTVRNGACEENAEVRVTVHPLPTFEVGQSQPREATIVPAATGAEPYEFFLDGASNPLETLVFDVDPGEHYVTVYDANDCESTATFLIDDSKIPVEIPSFFTPDGDGMNDVWKVGNLDKYPDAVVRIYDRFHKKLVEYDGTVEGWDGTYNGHPCVSTDYWYYIHIPELGKPFTGHFTLFRGDGK